MGSNMHIFECLISVPMKIFISSSVRWMNKSTNNYILLLILMNRLQRMTLNVFNQNKNEQDTLIPMHILHGNNVISHK